MSMAFVAIHFLRFMIYFFKRKGLTMPLNENLMIAVEHFNEFVNSENELRIIINN